MGRATCATLTLWCYAIASRCLTARCITLIQTTCTIIYLPCLILKYKYLQTKTLHKLYQV
ncbi:MAG: hypothetical protein NZ455_03110 [Bacteroidia bacterium]|nr:hypothetical protein [Bacteroidia bacterium]MDW8345515.1 hypothetical protein [Bacteroidia bacterium]